MLEKFDAYQFAKRFYWSCKSVRVPRFLQEQLLRASSSVVLNLAEGAGKRTPQDQRRFYAMAFGSLRESRAILEMEEIKDPAILRLADDLGAMLYVLSRKLPNPGQTPPLAVIATENKTDSDTDSVSAAPAPKM